MKRDPHSGFEMPDRLSGPSVSTWAAAIVAVLVFASLAPALWSVALMLLVAVSFWLGMVEAQRVVTFTVGPALVVLAAIGWRVQTVGWEQSMVVAAVLTIIGSAVNRRFRAVGGESIRAIEAANELIRKQAETDELTGLPNRAHYLTALQQRIQRGQPVAVMMMDLNRFKTINDTLGHGFGDEVLVAVARRLSGVIRRPDLVARLGGDEFAVLTSLSPSDVGASDLADRLASAVSQPLQLSGMSISTTLSIGVALSPRDANDVESLMRQADIAMYEAKSRGRTVQVFSTEIQQTPLEELTLSASLPEALSSGQFVLHYQPKTELATGRITGFEALARWEHPTLGLLNPDRFIHLVTLSDESQAFADRIIELGVQFAVRCRRHGANLPIAVNLSARSLFDDTLPDRTAHLLRSHGLPPDQLVIEITEADIMDEAGRSSRVIARLSELGVRISIDDFGTGYSSLARLVDLPISEVKIDRHFVSRAAVDHRDEVIVRSIVDLAETLDLHIVAEGVENPAEVGLLLNAGCDEAQGFLFSPPVPEEQALAMIDHVFPVAYRSAARRMTLHTTTEMDRPQPRDTELAT